MQEIQLLWIHNSQMAPDTEVKSHAHDYFHLIHVTEGQMFYAQEEEAVQLECGDVVLIHRGKIHRFANRGDQPLRFHEVKFAVQGQLLAQMQQSSDIQVIRDPFALQLVCCMAEEFARNRVLKDEAALAALSTLVMYLSADARSQDRQSPGILDTTGFNKLSLRVIDFLTDHYGKNISLDDISQGVGVTKNYLCNAFKLNTGITIIDSLNMIRIYKAAEQIVYSDLPLTEVARMCGYVSASHFNRVFMRYVGMPPGQCRRAYAYDVVGEDPRIPGSFLSCVLAGKPITMQIIREFENQK